MFLEETEGCSGSCASCGENCSSRQAPESLQAPANPLSKIKKVIAVVSGKGGVGKSTVTSMLAVALRKQGKRVGILDADITGPSIPKAFHITARPNAVAQGLLPVQSESGIGIMSINLLLENETDPVLWRGPIIAGTVKQFWTDVAWGELDVLFVDMPPGTGDVPLTVFQSLPIDGVLIVTSPQELVGMIVEKAVNMARMMEIPVIGFVENYSYLNCPDCGKKIELFGRSKLDEVSGKLGLPVLARLPLDAAIAAACDEGRIESADISAISPVLDAL